ncbi:LysR substrate-binding domain-containing protein [Methylomonas sp. LWB]|uniref:LysR substrate-binding domain-containing protein n=1 Tax=Methylomonas sp. LWB TaxID=1905845 RepID=UPI0009F577E5|nr:LysR substrate-binding domain-containing protein [Methylomonas sp. LWB]
MRRLPPLNALRVFEAAARHLNFSAAAEELCVTHSAVSHQIRLLEDWLGQSVFRRHSGGVHLTTVGASLQQAANHALSLLEASCSDILRQTQPEEIVVGAPGSFLANWLIPRLDSFDALNPGIRLRLQTCSDIAELVNRQVDALIVSGNPLMPRNINVTPLLKETIGPVCSPRLASQLQTPEDLTSLTLLHTASHQQAWSNWATALGKPSTFLVSGRQFDHLSLMLEAAATGLGIAIAPALLVERELERGRLVAPLGFLSTGTTFDLCILARRQDETAIMRVYQWFITASNEQ